MKNLIRIACLCVVSAPLLAQQPTRPAITGIAFARFYTSDPAAAQKFYGDTLGFTRIVDGGTSLYPVNHSQWIEVLNGTPRTNAHLAAVAFTTSDAARLERYLGAHNIMPELALADGQFSVRDPEGNLIIFVQAGSQKAVAAAPASPTAASTHIIHVGFMVDDRGAENDFWFGLLGFRPYWHGGHTDDITDWVALQVPDGSDWLEYMLNPAPLPTLRQAGSSDHFSLGVAHMQDAVAVLARNHCEGPNCTKTQIGRDGKVQLNLFDPDQTRVEFMEFTPVQKPCCSPFTAAHPTADENK
jgi:catechol 2,3-dioxygenase-like lactoylglutathione lyase family enzyme